MSLTLVSWKMGNYKNGANRARCSNTKIMLHIHTWIMDSVTHAKLRRHRKNLFRVAGENRSIFFRIPQDGAGNSLAWIQLPFTFDVRIFHTYIHSPHSCIPTLIRFQANSTSRALNSDLANVNRFYVEPLSIFHCDVQTIKMEMPTQTSSKGFVGSWTWKMSMSFEHWKLHEIKKWNPLPMPYARPLTTRMSIRCTTKIVNHFQLLHCICDIILPARALHTSCIFCTLRTPPQTIWILRIMCHESLLQKKIVFFFSTWNGSIRRQRRYFFITCFFHFCRHSIQ